MSKQGISKQGIHLKGKMQLAVLLILGCMVTACSGGSFKHTEDAVEVKSDGKETAVAYTAAKMDENTFLGSEGTRLACEQKGYLAVYDYYGLYVYDLNANKLQTSLDLKAIGCSVTPKKCDIEIRSEMNSDRLIIHEEGADVMYVFDYLENIVARTEYDISRCRSEVGLVDTGSFLELDYTTFRTAKACIVDGKDGKEYIWLESGSGMPIDLAVLRRKQADFTHDKTNEPAIERYYMFREE